MSAEHHHYYALNEGSFTILNLYIFCSVCDLSCATLKQTMDFRNRHGDIVAWWLRRRTSKLRGMGSNPALVRPHSNTLRQGMNP